MKPGWINPSAPKPLGPILSLGSNDATTAVGVLSPGTAPEFVGVAGSGSGGNGRTGAGGSPGTLPSSGSMFRLHITNSASPPKPVVGSPSPAEQPAAPTKQLPRR